MPKKKEEQFTCSFCGKTREKVKKLIAGPKVYICNECIELCVDVVREDSKESLLDNEKGEEDNDENLTPQQERLKKDFQLSRAVDLIKGLDIYKDSFSQ